jgi:hypothetical protein
MRLVFLNKQKELVMGDKNPKNAQKQKKQQESKKTKGK